MHVSVDKRNIEIDIAEAHGWVERIGKTAYEICNDPARIRIKLNEQHLVFMDKRRKTKVVNEMLMLFLMGTLPFMILPYALSISGNFFNAVISHFRFNPNRSDSPQYQLELSAQLSWLILLLDLSAFLVIAYISHLLSLEIAHTDHGKFVEWQGRKYFFHQR